MDTLIKILTILNTILILSATLVTTILKSTIEKYIDKKVASIDNITKLKQERILFTKKYTQENVIMELKSLFSMYMGFIDGTINSKGENKVENLTQKSLELIPLYGSSKTVELFADFKQFIFNNETDSNIMFAYVSVILSRLRFDFSNEWVEPKTFLEVNLKDLDKLSKEYDKKITDLKKYFEKS